MDFDSTALREFQTSTISRYRKEVSPEILRDYRPADKYVRFHEDEPDLDTIDIALPECPELHLIDGFGLKASEQFYKPLEIPEKLQYLPSIVEATLNKGRSKKVSVTMEDIWNFITFHQIEYKKEISFIRNCWYFRLHGYWCFINGKPTYIDGWHWFYTNAWKLDVGLPDYRDRDRKFFIAARYSYNTTESYYRYKVEHYKESRGRVLPTFFSNEKEALAFAKSLTDETGIPHSVDCGDYYVDMGRRTVIGFLWPKHRREGATYRASCMHFEVISRMINVNGGLQSMDEITAKKTWKQNVVKPWRAMFWMWKPEYRGSNQHTMSIDFQKELGMVNSGGVILGTSFVGLESIMDYATTGHEKHYDGTKLYFYHDDELGKLTAHDAYKRHQVTTPCLSQGDRSIIFGFTVKTSTSGEFNKGGGEAFLELCKDSMYSKRNKNGQTETGLLVFFIPAYEGLDGFIDQYGNSVVEDPTLAQADFINRDIGAREFLDNQESALLANIDNPKNQEKLLERYRLFPTKFRHCFMRGSNQTGFNTVKIGKRVTDLKFDRTKYQYGNYIRDKETNRVKFKPDPNGRWKVSKILTGDQSNQVVYDSNLKTFKPLHPRRRIACGDPFKFEKTEHRRQSDGAGAVFERRDRVLDGMNKPPEYWTTHRFVCTYSERAKSKDDYCEDMLAMCLYWGCLMSPEINVDAIWTYFVKNKASGMLYYFWDSQKRRFRETPGFNSTETSKQAIFSSVKDYTEYHCDKERHDDFLQECLDIPGIEKMKDFDVFTVCGGCLYTNENMEKIPIEIRGEEEKETSVQNIDLLDYFQPVG